MSQEVIRELDALNVTMNGGSTLLNIVLALVMFGVALGIKPATFVDIIRNPKSIITGIQPENKTAPRIDTPNQVYVAPFVNCIKS